MAPSPPGAPGASAAASTRHRKSVDPVATTAPVVGCHATAVTVDFAFFSPRDTHQLLDGSYVHTITCRDDDATANAAPSGRHLTSVAAREMRKFTTCGDHLPAPPPAVGSSAHTNALRSCDTDTSRPVTGCQSRPETSMSCCRGEGGEGGGGR